MFFVCLPESCDSMWLAISLKWCVISWDWIDGNKPCKINFEHVGSLQVLMVLSLVAFGIDFDVHDHCYLFYYFCLYSNCRCHWLDHCHSFHCTLCCVYFFAICYDDHHFDVFLHVLICSLFVRNNHYTNVCRLSISITLPRYNCTVHTLDYRIAVTLLQFFNTNWINLIIHSLKMVVFVGAIVVEAIDFVPLNIIYSQNYKCQTVDNGNIQCRLNAFTLTACLTEQTVPPFVSM